MTLIQARALHAAVRHAEHDPQRDRKALEALGRWLMRFTPVVALAESVTRAARPGSSPKKITGEPPVPQAIFLDLTGCEHVFGGIDNLVRQISAALKRLRIHARVSVASTPGAAHAIAMTGQDGAIVESPEQLQALLAPLPPVALRISEELSATLHHLGLPTIGQLWDLPRNVLPARFGEELLLRLDQALGRAPEPLVPLEHPSPVEARMDFDGVVWSLEAIWAVFQQLIDRIIAQLIRQGCGARRLDIELFQPSGPPVKKTIPLSHPSRDPAALFNLFRCAMEEGEARRHEGTKARRGKGQRDKETKGRRGRFEISNLKFRIPNSNFVGSASADGFIQHSSFSIQHSSLNPELRTLNPSPQSFIHDDGFVAMRLSVPLLERISEEQISLLGREDPAGQLELARLIDRLRIRMGEESVARVKLAESHVPERAWKEDHCKLQNANCKMQIEKQRSVPTSPQFDFCNFQFSIFNAPLLRPLCLLPAPLELRVMVSPSHDAEGLPVSFTHEGTVHAVAHAVGPERIAGVWWDGHDKTRDYFDVEDATGRRFWIFRVTQTGRWFLHGSFE